MNTQTRSRTQHTWAAHTLTCSRTSFASPLASLRGSLGKEEGRRQAAEVEGMPNWGGNISQWPPRSRGKYRLGFNLGPGTLSPKNLRCLHCLLLPTFSLLEAGFQRTHIKPGVPAQASRYQKAGCKITSPRSPRIPHSCQCRLAPVFRAKAPSVWHLLACLAASGVCDSSTLPLQAETPQGRG